MDQRITILITRQEELPNIFGALSQELTYLKNPATLFTTVKKKLNGRLQGILQHMEKQFLGPEKYNGDQEDAFAIRSLEIHQATEIIVFFFVRNFGEIVPVAAASKQYVAIGSPTLVKLKDLQWTMNKKEESYRRQFLSSFTRYNAKLRARKNYYAAKTPRYTIIQNRLLPFIKNADGKRKRSSSEDTKRPKEFQRLKESQTFHVILTDEKSTSSAADHKEHKKITDEEVERLRNENELLGLALRRAAARHEEMLKDVESNLEEKQKLADERKALEEDKESWQTEKSSLREDYSQRSQVLEADRAELVRNQQDLEMQRAYFANCVAVFADERESWERQRSALRSDLEQQERNLREDYSQRSQVLEADRAELVRNQQDIEMQRAYFANCVAVFADERESWETQRSVQRSQLVQRERELREEYQDSCRSLEEERVELWRLQREVDRQRDDLSSREAASLRELNTQRENLANREAAFQRQQNAQRENLAQRERVIREQERSLEREREEFRRRSAPSPPQSSGGSFWENCNYNPWSESDWPYYGVDDPWS